jgi:hypothetical protein
MERGGRIIEVPSSGSLPFARFGTGKEHIQGKPWGAPRGLEEGICSHGTGYG